MQAARYKFIRDPVSAHDLHATRLHRLGIDLKRLTCRFKGRDDRLSDSAGRVMQGREELASLSPSMIGQAVDFMFIGFVTKGRLPSTTASSSCPMASTM